MTETENKRMIWVRQQDNLRRGDVLERTQSEQHRKLVMRNMKETENEISKLRGLLRRKEYDKN